MLGMEDRCANSFSGTQLAELYSLPLQDNVALPHSLCLKLHPRNSNGYFV
jgi:hypothetical protein